MTTTRMGWLASTLAVIGLGAFAPSALGAFGAPVDVGSTGIGPGNPQVAADSNGDATLAWDLPQAGANQRIQARTLSAAGSLGTLHELGSATGVADRQVRVATDRAGDSVFAWIRSDPLDAILARRLSAGGTLGNTFTISGNSGAASDPDVATDRNGDTVFTWIDRAASPDRVRARTLSVSGALSPIRNVSTTGAIGSQPQVATDRSGDAVITWVREDGVDGDGDIVQARQISVNGSLGPIKDLSAPAGRAFAPQVASDEDGDVVFTWLRFDGNRDRAQGRTMTSVGALGSTFTLTPSGPSARDPQVAIDADGDAVFTWQRFEGDADRAQARTRTAAGVLGAITNLSAAGDDAYAPRVASRDNGDSVFVWLRFDGANDRVQARSMTAAGAFGAVQTVSAAGADALTPEVAYGSTSGPAVATWERAGLVQASRGP